MNKIAVYTCITGNYDTLLEISEKSDKIDYICFTDNKNLKSSTWKIRYLSEVDSGGILSDSLPFVKKQRLIKILSHRFLFEYDITLWIDANIKIQHDIYDFITSFDLNACPIYTNKHPTRKCIYQESVAVVKLRKDKYENFRNQILRYKNERFPANFGLAETNLILRDNRNLKNSLLELKWAKEILQGSHRDQLSFNYVIWKNNLAYNHLNIKYRFTGENDLFHLVKHNKSTIPFNQDFIKPIISDKNISYGISPLNKTCDKDVIVSMATYKPRLQEGTGLLLTLRSLVSQNTNFKYRICITMYEDDVQYISKQLSDFITDNNIELITSDTNLKPHLKYFYVMNKYRDCHVITVDDDVIYDDCLLQSLYNNYLKYPNAVSATRAHGMRFDANNKLLPYNNWMHELVGVKYNKPTYNLFTTGVGGVFYPADILKISENDLPLIYDSLCQDDVFLKRKENDLGIKISLVQHPRGNRKFYKLYRATAVSKHALSVNNNIHQQNDVCINCILKPSNIDVAYILDSNYIDITLLSLESLALNRNDFNNYRIHLILNNIQNTDGLNKINSFVSKFYNKNNFIIKTYNIDESTSYEYKNVRSMNHVTASALLKFNLSTILGDVSKVIYIDGDTIIYSDLNELFNVNLDNYYAAAVYDYNIMTSYGKKNKFYKKLLDDCAEYINSGVLVLNLEQIRKDGVESRLIKCKLHEKTMFMDQDVFNIIFRNKIKYISCKFNYLIKYFSIKNGNLRSIYKYDKVFPSDINEAKHFTTILHIAGKDKSQLNKMNILC